MAGITALLPGVVKPVIPLVAVTVQLKIVPEDILEEIFIGDVVPPVQIVCVKFELVITGISFKMNVNEAWLEPAQLPFTCTVIIYVL